MDLDYPSGKEHGPSTPTTFEDIPLLNINATQADIHHGQDNANRHLEWD